MIADIVYNEIVKHSSWEFILVDKRARGIAVKVLSGYRVGLFCFEFWRIARAIWTHYDGDVNARKAAVNDYAKLNTIHTVGSLYGDGLNRHDAYYDINNTLNRYLVDTLYVIDECYIHYTPDAFHFMYHQLLASGSILNFDKWETDYFTKIIRVACKSYERLIIEMLNGDVNEYSPRMLRVLSCEMSKVNVNNVDKFSDEVLVDMDDIIFDIWTYEINFVNDNICKLQRKYGNIKPSMLKSIY
ncbi:hypothetical protein E24_00505 [Faustovirus]|nr:hypothetical protein PRJ_Fausto_00473 [Faustovirus]AMN83418.1 hypothetical protein E24_00505 [Faustovirus]AMN84399.1 hypothetical protein D5a_00502 [Faustovirus]AMN85388.1 hypothetical protein E23_00505 [Faustovirus]QBR98929.1 hypothetical protein [Faustovirus mariensis]